MRLSPDLASRNWTLKLTALFLAILLWVAVRIEAPDRQLISGVPVQVVVNDSSWTLIGQPDPATIDVAFSGPMRALLPLGVQPPPLRIELDEVTSRDTVLTLSRDWVALPSESGVAVDELQPATIQLVFDRYETAMLPFEVATTGPLDSTLALAHDPEVIPARGRVRGPSRQLAQMTRIPLHALDLSDVLGSVSATMAVDTARLAPDIDVQMRTVQVELTVEPKLTRTFVSVPVQIENGGDLEADPATVDVVVQGAASLVERMTPFDVVLFAPMPTGTVGPEGVDIQVTLRNLPDFVSGQPAVEAVRIRPRSAQAVGGNDR